MNTFPLNPLGYLRHWLVAGPRETPYSGPPGEENVLRREALDPTRVEPPLHAELGATGPFGMPWRFHYPGHNFFVELSSFYFQLTLVDAYAFTEIESPRDQTADALFWVAGAADLWLNGTHLTRFDPIRYMYPDAQPLRLPLRRGPNTLCVRLQCFGVRDTRILFGLQLRDAAPDLRVRLPGPAADTAALVAAAAWLDGVRTEGRSVVTSTLPAPLHAEIRLAGPSTIPWQQNASRIDLAGVAPFRQSVAVTAAGQTLLRNFEIPANQAPAAAPAPGSDFQRPLLERIAAVTFSRAQDGRGFVGLPALTARRLLGRSHPDDAPAFAHAIARTDLREDCADFTLAMLLRLLALGLATPEEGAEIRRTALAFRYWNDEPGNDAMCFWSENHSLLFHGCQRIAGLHFPAETFTNSGRTGAEQAALALDRCRAWLDHLEPRGFDEFLSSVYMPITVLALLNLVDFAQDADISRRAAALIDRIYRDLALQSFRGVTVGPQGRVYRDVLYPEKSGTQMLLAFATPEARCPAEDGSDTAHWYVFLASSPAYRPPKDLAELMRQPASRRYRHASVEIVLHKTRDYLLTSLAIPAPLVDEKGQPAGLQPGWGGYQQHAWQATLAPGCHVFVNHPGCSFDESKARPGYWYGNGVLPRVTQHDGALTAIYSIPDGSQPYPRRSTAEWFWPIGGCPVPFDLHPIPFTHAHWPADAFDRQEIRDHWAFGQKDSGYVALWCSAPLQPHDDVLTGRELRAWAPRCAWLVLCGSVEQDGPFADFIDACLARQPEFDPESLALRTA
jgi:hypothetical protein